METILDIDKGKEPERSEIEQMKEQEDKKAMGWRDVETRKFNREIELKEREKLLD